MPSKRIKKPIRKKNKSDYPGEMSFRKALGNNPIYYQEDNSTIPVTVKYGSPEYEQAYNQGTLVRASTQDDILRARTLPEFKVTPKYTSLSDDLRRAAILGVEEAAESTGVPGTVRFAKNPVQSLKGIGNTLVDLGLMAGASLSPVGRFDQMNPMGGMQYATQGINPLTGEGSYRAEDVEGAFNTLDAVGTATVLGSALKAPLKQGLRQTAKNNLFKTLDTKKTQFSKALQGSSNLFNEIIGELKQGKLNRKSIEEGNKWLQNYINHPSTQMRIDIAAEDAIKNIDQKYSWLGNSPEDIPFKQALINEDANFINLVREQTKKFKPNSKEYSLLKQFKDNLQQYLSIKAEAPIHLNNWGVSYMHNVNPSSRELIKTGAAKPFDRYGSWISRTSSQPQPNRVSTTIHEGGHDWLSAEAFETLGQRKIALDPNNVAQEAIDSYLKKEQLINEGKTSEEILEILGEKENYVAYLAEPTEQHARIMELRAAANLPPDYSMDEATAKKMLEWIKSGHSPVEKSFAYIVDYDANKLKNLFNKFLVAPTIMGVGAAGTYGANQLMNQQQMRRQGGKLYYQQDVGQLPLKYVDNKDDPAFIAYKDSFDLARLSQIQQEREGFNRFIPLSSIGDESQKHAAKERSNKGVNPSTPQIYDKNNDEYNYYKDKLSSLNNPRIFLSPRSSSEFYHSSIFPTKVIVSKKGPLNAYYPFPKQRVLVKPNEGITRNIHQYPFRHPVTGETEDRVSLITPAHQYIMTPQQYSKLLPTDSIPQQGNYLYRTNYKELGGKLRFARGGSLTSAQDTAQATDLNKDVMRKDIKKASIGEDFMAGLYGVGEGLVDTLTFGLTDELTDAGFKGLQAAAGHDVNSVEAKRQAGIKGWGNVGGAVTGAFINPASAFSAGQEGLEGIGQGIQGINPEDKTLQAVGKGVEGLGNIQLPKGMESMEGMSKIFMARNGGRFRYGYQGGGHMLNQNMGLTEIDGPSHEEGGVTLPNNGGRPDVEVEGPETIYTPENYVMSEKMKASLEALEFAGITGKSAKRLAGKSYADLSKMVKSKAGDKLRPNDPLSKKMLDKEMKKLMMAHEYDREAKRMQDEAMRSQMMGGSNIVAETPEERAGGYNMYPNAQSIAFPGSGPTSVVPTYNNDPIMVTGADGSQQMLTDEPIETEAPFIEEKMAQGGKMIKRADGSYSRRGLWDNIRANRGSGKKPTKQMLEQEAKIKAAEKAYGGYYAEGGSFDNPGFRALPGYVQAKIKSNMEVGGYMGDYIGDDDTMEYGEGGYTVRRSNDRKGKTHVVIGPDGTKKYFGDPKLGERGKSKYGKDAFYARHKKNLAKNPYFRAYARATWEDGGYMDMLNANIDIPDMEAPMYAYGGPMMYAQGGIHIAPSKRGTFKAQASKMGMGVQEAARTILNAPEGKYSPAMRKKANFARNFAKEYGGYYQMGGEMMQAPQQGQPQGGGGEEQILQQVAQMLQQGMSPEEIVGQLVQMGVPQEQAIQIVQMVVQQMQGQQQAPQQEPQQAPPMMRGGGYMYQMGGEMAPQQQAQGGEEQIVQAITEMLQQGMQPEEIVAQLVQMGLPQEAAIQAVQMVMQQSQQGQQQQMPAQAPAPMMRYGGRVTKQMGGSLADNYLSQVNQYPVLKRNGGKLYYQQKQGFLPNTTGTLENILNNDSIESGVYQGADAIAIGNQADANAARANSLVNSSNIKPIRINRPSLMQEATYLGGVNPQGIMPSVSRSFNPNYSMTPDERKNWLSRTNIPNVSYGMSLDYGSQEEALTGSNNVNQRFSNYLGLQQPGGIAPFLQGPYTEEQYNADIENTNVSRGNTKYGLRDLAQPSLLNLNQQINALPLNSVKAGLLPIPTTTSKPSLPSLMNNEVELTGLKSPEISPELEYKTFPAGKPKSTPPPLPEYKSPMGNYIAGGVGSMFGPLANAAAAAFAPDPTYTAAPKFKKFDYTPVALQRAAGNQAMANTRQAIRMGAPTQGSYLANVGVSMPSAGAQIGSQVAQTRYGIDSQNIGLMNQEAQLRAAQAEKNALMKDQSISNRWKLGMEAAAGVGRNIQGFSKDMGAKEMQDQLLNQLRTGDFAIIGYDNVNGTLVPKLAPAGVATYNDGTITLSNGQRARRNPDTGKYEIIPQ